MPERLRRHATRLTLTLTALAALAIGGIATAAPAAADVDDFTFNAFHADMLLSRAADGHAELSVTETIVARFPDEDQNRGIIRAIPDDYDGVPLHTDVLAVTDAEGFDIPYEVSEAGDFVEVATGDDSYVRGVQTYVIRYTQRDSIRAFADTDSDEFYRDINGTGWDQPFGEVSTTIAVAPGIIDALTGNNACYVGSQGSTERCELTPPGASLSARATDLAPGENLTVAIGFERGTFVPGEVVLSPTEQFAIDAAPALQAGSGVAAVLALGTIGAALAQRRRTRDAAGRGTIVAQYDPPSGLTVMQAAHLVGRGTTPIPAAIVDLAVTRHLRIVELNDIYSLEFVQPAPGDPARQRVLDTIFGYGARPNQQVVLHGDTSELAKRMSALSASEAQALRDAGLRQKRPLGLWGVVFAVVLLAFFASVGLLVFTASAGAVSWIAIAAVPVTAVAGIIALLFWPYGDRVTEAGADARDHLIGLRDYLRLAETDRLRILQSPEGAERSGAGGDGVLHLYERLLPYAIIWGVEKDWSRVLESRAQAVGTGVDWYAGSHGFSSVYLISALSATQSSTSASAQAWQSSGGSSFSGGSFGGGFSGGGAGGGGGGGR